MQQSKVIISEKNNPIGERILASFFYTISAAGIILFILGIMIGRIPLDFSFLISLFVFCLFEGIFLFYAFQLSKLGCVYFDLENNKYKKVYDFGFLKIGRWKKLPFIEYLSISRFSGTYETHLKFLDDEEHIIFIADTYQEIFSIAYDTAKQINVGFYDEVNPNTPYWVDKKQDKKSLLKGLGLYVEKPTCVLPSNNKFEIQNKKKIIVSEGQKALWKRAAAALFFTISLIYIVYFIAVIFEILGYIKFTTPALFYVLFYYLLVGVIAAVSYFNTLVTIIVIEFDLHHNCFRKIHNYGWFKRKKKWKCTPEIEYISLYYQERDSGYEVSLWDENNKALELFKGNNLGETFRLAYEVAHLHKVDLYNATDFNNSYWIDMELSKEELFQELIRKNK